MAPRPAKASRAVNSSDLFAILTPALWHEGRGREMSNGESSHVDSAPQGEEEPKVETRLATPIARTNEHVTQPTISDPTPDDEKQQVHNRKTLFWGRITFFVILAYTLIAAWQTSEIRKTRMEGNRAWLVATDVRLTTGLVAGLGLEADINVVNAGNTPAVDQLTQTHLDLREWGSSYDLLGRNPFVNLLAASADAIPMPPPDLIAIPWPPQTPNDSVAVIGPKVTAVAHAKSDPVSADDVAAVQGGHKRFVLLGHFRYRDLYGSPHETLACAEWPTQGVSNAQWRLCPTGNTAR